MEKFYANLLAYLIAIVEGDCFRTGTCLKYCLIESRRSNMGAGNFLLFADTSKFTTNIIGTR